MKLLAHSVLVTFLANTAMAESTASHCVPKADEVCPQGWVENLLPQQNNKPSQAPMLTCCKTPNPASEESQNIGNRANDDDPYKKPAEGCIYTTTIVNGSGVYGGCQAGYIEKGDAAPKLCNYDGYQYSCTYYSWCCPIKTDSDPREDEDPTNGESSTSSGGKLNPTLLAGLIFGGGMLHV